MKRLVALGLSLVVATSALAADWPQFRGPKRDGVSAEKGLLKSWPEGGPKLVWKYTDGGLAFSSVAIVDGTLYTLGTRGKRESDEVVLALDAAKGTELWTAKIGPTFTFQGNVWGDGPRSTPTIDGNLLYALGGQGDLVCVDIAKKGAEVWRKNLITDFGGDVMTEWGYSESPLVDGDRVIVTPGGEKGLVVALDKKTGKLLWQSSDVAHKAPYSSVIPAELDGVRQYIQLSFKAPTGGFVNSFDAATGKKLWQAPIFTGSSYAVAPTPILKDNLVYVTSGYGGGCHTFEVGKGFTIKDLIVKKEQKKVKNTHGGVVLVDGKIYGHSENTGWVCQDLMTGDVDAKKKMGWVERNGLNTKSGSITAAEGMLYLYTEDGDVGLVKATPAKFDLVSEFKLPQLSQFPAKRATSKESKAWNYPVIANGKLFIRDCELIYCYDIAAK